MSLRPVVAIAVMLLLLAANLFLVYQELTPDESGQNRIAPAERQIRHSTARTDPLFDMRFTKTDRESNLKRMGLPPTLVNATLKALVSLEDRHGSRLQVVMDSAEDPQELATALCGKSSDLRPRYGALRFLVEEDRGTRRPVDLQRVTLLRRQEWSRADLIASVYEGLELADDRREDAPLMGIAAILLGKEAEAVDSVKPWDRAPMGTWSWEVVVKENPGIDSRIVDYFALMHLSAELAQSEGGLCGD
jgi:hypothetical protein